MRPKTARWLGALVAAAAVALGAFGAHGLKARVDQGKLSAAGLETFETAVRYQFLHALGLCLAGLSARYAWRGPLRVASGLFLGGICLFSGLLYAYLASGLKPLVWLVPLGGVALIAGWLALALGYALADDPQE